MRHMQPCLVASGMVALLSFSANPLRAEEPCPLRHLGVSSSPTEAGETFYASAFVRPFKNDDESLIEAQQEARIAARILLAHDKRVPLGVNGRLVGARDEGTCSNDGRVFFTVSISAKSAAQAIELKERMRKSLAVKPTPQIPSYSWTGSAAGSAEMKEIERLMKR